MFTVMASSDGDGSRRDRWRASAQDERNTVEDWLRGTGATVFTVFALLLGATLLYVIVKG